MSKIFEYETPEHTYRFQDNEDSVTAPFIINEVIVHDCYKLREAKIPEDGEIIDVGSNIGIFTVAAHLYFGCKVIAFEPVQASWMYGLVNQGLNGIIPGNIDSYRFAVGSEGVETQTVLYHPWRSGNASVYGDGTPVEAPSISLLPYISPRTSMIKLDCEGGEYDILPEILPYIKHVPYLRVEAHPIPGAPMTVDQLHRLVDSQYPGDLTWIIAQ